MITFSQKLKKSLEKAENKAYNRLIFLNMIYQVDNKGVRYMFSKEKIAIAIEALKDGQRNIMVGVKNDQIVYVPFNKAIRIDKPIDRELINVLNVLSI